ncbi:MAG: CocE/NonD family hydrolase [Candidatus Binatia bacterium]
MVRPGEESAEQVGSQGESNHESRHRAGCNLLVGSLLFLGTAAQVGAEMGDEFDEVVIEETFITDRFGDNLKTFLYFPAEDGARAEGPFPVILMLRYANPNVGGAVAPSNEQARLRGSEVHGTADGFARRGYVFADVNWHGTAPSDGGDAFFTRKMQLSGYDAVEWLAGVAPNGDPSPAAAWSTGKVGMYGGSGVGISQVVVAQHNPPHLVAITPHVSLTDAYGDFFYRGGIRTNAEAAAVGYLYGAAQIHCASVPNDAAEVDAIAACLRKRAERLQILPPLLPLEWWQHPTYGPYWEFFTANVPAIRAAIWSIASWDDHFLRGNVTLYRDGTSPRMFAVGWAGHSIGDGFDNFAETGRWFDYWLKGETDNGIAEELVERPVRYYTIQEDAWHEATAWPIPGTVFTDLYLDGNPTLDLAAGSLSWSQPASDGADSFLYTPAQGRHNGNIGVVCRPGRPGGFDARDGNLVGANLPNCPGDQRLEAVDSPTHKAEPLAADVEMTGPITMTLHAASSVEDTDWVVKIIDVFPDDGPVDPASRQPGYWNLVTTGWLKGTHRNGHVTPEPIPVGEVVAYEIEIFPTSYLFRAGHRIGVQIASGDAARTWPNPVPAENSVHHSPAHPSRVTLPILPR